MGEAAKLVRRLVIDRTQRSVDLRGGKFKPYTSKYQRAKRQSKVDLTKTGDMLGNLRTRDLTDHSFGVGYRTNKRIKKVKGVEKLRKFVGLTRKEESRVTQFITRLVRQFKIPK